MLVHICCSVDSHFFLQELRRILPDEELIGYFYDPNIHPFSEYELRYFDVEASCRELGIKLIKGEYDFGLWLEATKGLESEPERGKRCEKCFDLRMQKSVEMALKLGQKSFTTTLLASPKKDLEKLEISMRAALAGSGLEFFCVDFRKNGGTQKQLKMAKESKRYFQNYCGCLYAMRQQFCDEIYTKELSSSAIKGEILPASADEKIALFRKLQENKENYEIIRQKFLNYRLLYAKISSKKRAVKARILFYSHFRTKRFSLSLDTKKDLQFCNKDELCVIKFAKCKEFFGLKDFDEFCCSAISVEKQIEFRRNLLGEFDLSPVIILDEIPEKIEIVAKSMIFPDVKLKLI